MEEVEFKRLLALFPVVRSRDYNGELEPSKELASHAAHDEVTEWKDAWNEMDKKDDVQDAENEDPFWQKLRLAAEGKVGPAKAARFCEAVKRTHKQLVYEELTLDSARKFLDGFQK
ncbi:uncharacterized protein M6B38_397885 [Iris pallida]|uniref:Uncharacterized protein n=1 Tax=Iris pallida TaxID=29817 RepID=A0AAX6FUU7_IRIPA|nr:uncharacterized protein M6B38_397885 [Iris pallida]